MSITVSSQRINKNENSDNSKRKVIILGSASSDLKAREIINPRNKEEALSLYGNSELYRAYCLLFDMNVPNIYTCNCWSESDYLRAIDKILHYDFDFLIPIGLYLSDKFYNPIVDTNEYYAEYFVRQLAEVNSLTTVLMTERHASLYEDFDSFMLTMSEIENNFITSLNIRNKKFLMEYGNNLNFVFNNIKDLEYSNVLLAGLYCTRDFANYFPDVNHMSVVYHLNNIDVQGMRGIYFKYNYYTNTITVENPLNFKTELDIYANALIDDTIKMTIRVVDLNKYKGMLYTPYVCMQIKDDVSKSLNKISGRLIKTYKINNISFKKTGPTSGYIIADYSITPYGTLENINVIMGAI